MDVKEYGDDPINSKDGRFIILMSMNLSVKKHLTTDFSDSHELDNKTNNKSMDKTMKKLNDINHPYYI